MARTLGAFFRKPLVRWLLVLLLPYVLLGVVSMGVMFFLLPMGAIIGVPMLYTTHVELISLSGKIQLSILLALALALFAGGLVLRRKLAGKYLVSAGIYLWSFIGFVVMGINF